MTIEELEKKIQVLENENRLLKERLTEAGISYADIYWRDLSEAKQEVIISSPRLNTEKVKRIISVLGEKQEMGVKVTIVTWHPDYYKYGRDEVRMNLLELLRRAGVELRLVEDNCEHFAVIDKEIVWYGSVNLRRLTNRLKT